MALLRPDLAALRRRALCGLAGMLALAASALNGLQASIVFDRYSPLSRNEEMARRLLSPLEAERVRRQLAATGEAMRDQAVDLAQERFLLDVPAHAPPTGYGLLVFIPPWPDARLPAGWGDALDRRGVIFVTAAHSGNDDSAYGRRNPLALIAAANVMARYPVDPARVYVGGFSGGSRVAMRLALAYPDLFRGALLDAGSDPAGSGITRLPSRALWEEAEGGLRLVFLTGEHDEAALSAAADSVQSMRRNCLLSVQSRTLSGLGHELAGGDSLARGLDLLDQPKTPDPARLAACRAALQRSLDEGVEQVRQDLARGDLAAARKRIIALDTRFGGLAEQRLVDLAETCGCGVFPPPSQPLT
ncbi:PHB depolymerase family esterase [Phenylobacterium montanum]|uniref:Alpha/beta hydrolase n=1 Tax=Phenylobacterium montanum TaxID=2823693 RepID=A0A975FZY5_9CAUL|nr:PHB depolymerase family esterase [Caulobacter sp. S6]QUD87968.1 hypothetical protein KCG34_23520 [Caulobacter sp. S6]